MRTFIILTLFFLSCNQRTDNNSETSAMLYDLDNSSLVITDHSEQFHLSRCEVVKDHDTMFLNFSDTSKRSNWYELRIFKIKEQIIANFNTTFSIADSSYKRPIFTTYQQNINLNKSDYKIGDSIIGKISLSISSYNQWPEGFTDTIKIAGDFRAIVQ